MRDDIVDLLCFIEELPPALSDTYVPWGWTSWAEYADRARDQATAVQPFAYTAHNALRAAVMGHEAWERAATADEVRAMAALLDEALRAGSLGMSSNWFDTDRQRRLVPSRLADGDELDALLDVIARHPGATFQVIARKQHDRRDALGRSCGRGIRSLSLGDGVGGGKVEEGLTTWYLGGGNEPFQPDARLPDVDRHRRHPAVARPGQRTRRGEDSPPSPIPRGAPALARHGTTRCRSRTRSTATRSTN